MTPSHGDTISQIGRETRLSLWRRSSSIGHETSASPLPCLSAFGTSGRPPKAEANGSFPSSLVPLRFGPQIAPPRNPRSARPCDRCGRSNSDDAGARPFARISCRVVPSIQATRWTSSFSSRIEINRKTVAKSQPLARTFSWISARVRGTGLASSRLTIAMRPMGRAQAVPTQPRGRLDRMRCRMCAHGYL